MDASANGTRPLLHRFKERRLGFRRRPVNLVGEDDVAEYRSLDECPAPMPRTLVFLDDVRTGDI
jgi:hypothetical protein